MKMIESIEGVFGNISHFVDGEYCGETLPGYFPGTYDHYDHNGNYIGGSVDTITGRRTILDIDEYDNETSY